MGFLVPIFASLFGIFSLIVSYEGIISLVKTENEINTFLNIKTTQALASQVPIQRYKEEELETALIKLCQTAQSMIIQCQNCYISGRTNCPYPTNSFCLSARGVNYNDPTIVWGFLPNPSGDFTDVYSAPVKDINTLTDVSELPEGIRYLLVNQISQESFAGYSYLRPSGSFADACAVEGVITR